MELVWEDPPVPEGPFFTRDSYDKYSLAPNIRELWAFLQSPAEDANVKAGCEVGAAKASCSSSTEGTVEFKDDGCVSKDDPCQDGCNGDDPCAGNEADRAFLEPRIPYPCWSNLSSKEQRMYLHMLRKRTMTPPQKLKARIDDEVMHFTRYLHDVAKACADDYSFISPAALQYSEDFFRCCLESVKTLPQLYQIHEMTSLTGGTFNPGLRLTFEKQLLILGNVDITDHKLLPADAQLASDYQSVSSVNPAAKKAKDMHATVSGDSNAESLSARYEPHVCLTRNALVQLLDNHGPDFREQWEMPVWVKSNPGKGNNRKKTVYIDSPLLKSEMTVRERSHIYHEESLKLSIKKDGSKNMFHLMTELPASEQQLSPESTQRNAVSFEDSSLGFDVDLTDLETFGESSSFKKPGAQATGKEQDARVKSTRATVGSQEDANSSVTDVDEPMEATTQPVVSAAAEPKAEQSGPLRAQGSDKSLGSTGDSDDEKLVIDVSVSSARTPTKEPKTPPRANSPVSESVPAASESPSPQKPATQRRRSKRARVSGDQLSDILRMQTAMFSSASDAAKGPATTQEAGSPARCAGPPVHAQPVSLVKPCVSSYLERNPNQDGETFAAPQESPVLSRPTTEPKKILSQDLQAGAEDEQDYEAPEEGNLLYKLYSLQELLLMVRSSVSFTHTRKLGSDQNKYVPVHVLPKLEYQLSYGVESLSSSEACQLWTETLLHSSTVSYTAHINALTSKVALLRKLPDDWQRNISCGFKPSKSLNILHHLLKKLTGLEEGHYLITHKAGEPFVTLLKAAKGKMSRGAYDLRQIHGSAPKPPVSGPVPWIPVDPTVVLPFHQRHGRVPCTFPPMTAKDGSSQANNRGAGQSNGLKAGGNAKKKKNRAARRNQYIKKLVQKSV